MVGVAHLFLEVKGSNPNVNIYFFYKLINLYYNVITFYLTLFYIYLF